MKKTELVLVNIYQRHTTAFCDDAPPLGLLSIASYADERGVKSIVLSGDNTLRDFIELGCIPSLVGFYVNSDNKFAVGRMVRRLRDYSPDIKFIVGGPLAMAQSEECLKVTGADFVCLGDGEEVTFELISHLSQDNSNFKEISGVGYFTASQLFVSKKRELVGDLDKYPLLNRKLYIQHEKNKTFQVVTGRGCSQACAFCFESVHKQRVRFHSVERVINEVRGLVTEFDAKYFSFVDDAFTVRPDRVVEVCKSLRNEFNAPNDLIWYCEARVDDIIHNVEMLRKMISSGLSRLQIGTESGVDSIIEKYNKKITTDQIRQAVKIAHDEGLSSLFTNVIIGGAGETHETLDVTLQFALELMDIAPGVIEISCGFLAPYPGTMVYENPHDFDVGLSDKDFIFGTSIESVSADSFMISSEELIEFSQKFDTETYKKHLEQVPSLPRKRILSHLNNAKHGLKSRWANVLLTDPIFKNWVSLTDKGYHEKVSSMGDKKQYDCLVPFRTFNIEHISENTFTWIFRKKSFAYSDFEHYLLRICAGKLSILEIAKNVIETHWGSGVDLMTLCVDITKFYNQLANEFLLVFQYEGIPASEGISK